MSKKRYGDRRLESMTRDQLLVYAKQLTRDHGRAQESINRLRAKLDAWEAGAPPVPVTPVQGASAPNAPVPGTPVHPPAPHRAPHCAPHHRRMVLREVRRHE
jgi:hypothetical protein